MGLFDFLLRLFRPRQTAESSSRATAGRPVRGDAPPAVDRNSRGSPTAVDRRAPPKLVPLRYDAQTARKRSSRFAAHERATETPAYAFSRLEVWGGKYRDLSRDGDDARLAEFGLPVFHTPAELADWLGLPVGRLAWLVHRFSPNDRPEDERRAHYHYRWMRKRSGGLRLIESPKPLIKAVQTKILREILDRVPPHPDAHGFVAGRSIVTNARPHVGQRVVVKFDLQNFYASVTFARIAAIFRSLGYAREAAIWLARLTTSALPPNQPFPHNDPAAILPFLPRHLPQGAPTSPALANLSAYALDVRLGGLARSFSATYSRYADDLTFSGPQQFLRGLRVFIPLTTQIIRDERFRVQRRKRKVIRGNQRQTVAGVVVNARPNVARRDYDRLKATLTNCLRHGPASQNREDHPDFAASLRGRIAHVMHLNPARGAKLLELFQQIRW